MRERPAEGLAVSSSTAKPTSNRPRYHAARSWAAAIAIGAVTPRCCCETHTCPWNEKNASSMNPAAARIAALDLRGRGRRRRAARVRAQGGQADLDDFPTPTDAASTRRRSIGRPWPRRGDPRAAWNRRAPISGSSPPTAISQTSRRSCGRATRADHRERGHRRGRSRRSCRPKAKIARPPTSTRPSARRSSPGGRPARSSETAVAAQAAQRQPHRRHPPHPASTPAARGALRTKQGRTSCEEAPDHPESRRPAPRQQRLTPAANEECAPPAATRARIHRLYAGTRDLRGTDEAIDGLDAKPTSTGSSARRAGRDAAVPPPRGVT